MKIQSLKELEAEMKAVVKGEIPAPPDAHLPSAESSMTKGKIARKIEDAGKETLDEISRAKVSPEHAELDSLLKDWTP